MAAMILTAATVALCLALGIWAHPMSGIFALAAIGLLTWSRAMLEDWPMKWAVLCAAAALGFAIYGVMK